MLTSLIKSNWKIEKNQTNNIYNNLVKIIKNGIKDDELMNVWFDKVTELLYQHAIYRDWWFITGEQIDVFNTFYITNIYLEHSK